MATRVPSHLFVTAVLQNNKTGIERVNTNSCANMIQRSAGVGRVISVEGLCH